ncbi:rhomboid family intramembrane serine protease [Niabella insulamsoli]|uniref:rhomboid family intramembrane serine protease n=1 Tax=Niabella insulamsoli TaxID=3144874 RepID=UPI0031FDE919
MSFFQRPTEQFPPAIKNLILINVLVWVGQLIFDNRLGPVFADGAFVGGFTAKIALWPFSSEHFKPWQLVTHMFAHAAWQPYLFVHILFNMLALWMFGRVLENVWGSKRFLIFYMICGLGAAVAHLLTDSGMAVGASGAVFGVLVAFAMTFPNTELYIMFIPIPIKAKWAVIGLIALDLFGGIYKAPGDSVAHFAHLGGALTGFILLKIWNKNNRRTLY